MQWIKNKTVLICYRSTNPKKMFNDFVMHFYVQQLYTCTHEKKRAVACTKCIGDKWTHFQGHVRVIYLLLRSRETWLLSLNQQCIFLSASLLGLSSSSPLLLAALMNLYNFLCIFFLLLILRLLRLHLWQVVVSLSMYDDDKKKLKWTGRRRSLGGREDDHHVSTYIVDIFCFRSFHRPMAHLHPFCSVVYWTL